MGLTHGWEEVLKEHQLEISMQARGTHPTTKGHMYIYIYICIYIYTNSYVREWMVLLFFFFLFFIFASRKRGSTQTIHILFTLQWWSFSFLSWSLLPLPSLLVRVFQK